MAQYLLVAGVAQCNLVKVVLVHEIVKDIGAEHERLGYAHGRPGILVELRVALDYVVDEGQSAPLAAQRAVADACEVAVGVELSPVEDGHHADVLHPAVLHDGIEDYLPVRVNVLQLVPGDVLEECRHGEYGPGREPAAHVVAAHVVEHRVVWYGEDVVLQFLQRAYAQYLAAGLGVVEHEVAEAHVLFHEAAQVDVHLLRVLVDEAEALGLGLLAVFRLGALQD